MNGNFGGKMLRMDAHMVPYQVYCTVGLGLHDVSLGLLYSTLDMAVTSHR